MTNTFEAHSIIFLSPALPPWIFLAAAAAIPTLCRGRLRSEKRFFLLFVIIITISLFFVSFLGAAPLCTPTSGTLTKEASEQRDDQEGQSVKNTTN